MHILQGVVACVNLILIFDKENCHLDEKKGK